MPGSIKTQALLAVKDHYTFDFLGLSEEYSERELEQALVRNLHSFLSEMGGAFTFVGNQYQLEVDGKEYYIALLLFHRHLHCLVAIKLKIGDLKPEHKGQIEFYLDTLDQLHSTEGENDGGVRLALHDAPTGHCHLHLHRHPAAASQLPQRPRLQRWAGSDAL